MASKFLIHFPEAAITILRIDDMIKLNPEEKSGKSYGDACAAGELDG